MNSIIAGCFAISLMGHDKGEIYVIVDSDEKYVYLCDGRYKTVDTPKKKSYKHIQQVNRKDANIESTLAGGGTLTNEHIKRAIKTFKAKNRN